MIQVKLCPDCRHANDVKESNCSQCFESLVAVQPTPQAAEKQQTANKPAKDSSTFTCCGQEHAIGEECFICGGEADDQPDPPSEPLVVTLPAQTQSPPKEFELVLNSGRSIPVNSGVLLGRNSACINGQLLHETQEELGISRIHAWVGSVDGQHCIIDLASTNGTFMNGQRLKQNEAVPIEGFTSSVSIRLGKHFQLVLRQRDQ